MTRLESSRRHKLFVASVVSAAVSMAALIPATQAATTTSASNIDTAQSTTLKIHKYGGTECVGNSAARTGTTEDAAHVDTEKCKALAGVSFSVSPVRYNNEKIDLATSTGWSKIDANSNTGMSEANFLNATTGEWEPTDASFTLGDATVVTTDAQGLATFTKTAGDFGLYYVKEISSSEQVSAPVRPFLVTLPYPKSGAGEWLYTVDVYPKNKTTGAKLNKKAEAPTGVNQVLPADDAATTAANREQVWWIQAPLPTYATGFKAASVTDPLPDSLGIDTATGVEVYVSVDKPGADATALVANTDYSVTPAGGTTTFGSDVVITILNSANGLQALKNASAENKSIWIKLTTVIDETAVTDANAGVILNAVKAHFEDNDDTTPADNPTTDPTPENPDPNNPNNGVSKWGVVELQKYEGDPTAAAAFDNTKSLKGAIFTLFEITGVETPTAQQCQEAVIGTGSTKIADYTTGDDGKVKIKAYVGNTKEATSKTYCLRETQAPAGYTTPSAEQGTRALLVNASGESAQTVAIANKKSGITDVIKLPLTGAAGLAVLTLGGAALLGGGALWLFAARRRRRDEDIA